jgi:hypothetical protein
VAVSLCGRVAAGSERGAAPAPRRGAAPAPRRGAAPAPVWGLRPMWSGGGVAPCTPSWALPLHPGQEKRGWAPLLSWQSLIRALCTARDDVPGHTLHGGPTFTRVSDCVRARRCTAIAHMTTPREHEAAPGPSAAHSCTNDDESAPLAAPGPSRTCASWEATRLGARCLCWREETSVSRVLQPSTRPPSTTTAMEWAARAAS